MVNPLVSKAVANKAVSLAQTALQNEAVRKQIRDAPEAVSRWAKSLQRPDGTGGGAGALAGLARLDPTARFGQQGLERRLDALSDNVKLVFPDPADPTRDSTRQAIYELRRALIIASPLPLLKRKKVHLRIDAELSVLEQALVDAVLPPTGDVATATPAVEPPSGTAPAGDEQAGDEQAGHEPADAGPSGDEPTVAG